MPAEQALAPAAPPDDELAAVRLLEVPPDWLPCPVDDPGLPPCPPTRDGAAHAVHAEQGQPSPHQFALLIVETLSGARPARQLAPLLSRRAAIHLQRLLPLFRTSIRPRVLRVLTSMPAAGVVEMTLVAEMGPRTRALAVRLERAAQTASARRDAPAARWLCTAIEAA